MSSHKTFAESGGLALRKILAVIWFILPLILVVSGLILVPPIVEALIPEESREEVPLQVLDVQFREATYYDILNETSFELQVKFNRPVEDGYVTVAFFDAAGNKTDEFDVSLHTRNYKTTDNYLVNVYDSARGQVVSCEVVDFSDIVCPEEKKTVKSPAEAARNAMLDMLPLCILWALIRLLYVLPAVKYILAANCKVYFVGGCYVTVYSGWSHHYLKADGNKMVEQVQYAPSIPIVLLTEVNGYRVDVTIDPKNRYITLKSNGEPQLAL